MHGSVDASFGDAAVENVVRVNVVADLPERRRNLVDVPLGVGSGKDGEVGEEGVRGQGRLLVRDVAGGGGLSGENGGERSGRRGAMNVVEGGRRGEEGGEGLETGK